MSGRLKPVVLLPRTKQKFENDIVGNRSSTDSYTRKPATAGLKWKGERETSAL